ncbi:MAG TPA: hypothetical protein PLU49_06925 [Saprospiraceae bacterium]|nr:hypothetical protein [Saprospiraceae bacterium]
MSEQLPNKGNVRETYFLNQLRTRHDVAQSKISDFLIDDKYTLEVGGATKSTKQIQNIENAWIVRDDIELKVNNILPLWIFGFLY